MVSDICNFVICHILKAISVVYFLLDLERGKWKWEINPLLNLSGFLKTIFSLTQSAYI